MPDHVGLRRKSTSIYASDCVRACLQVLVVLGAAYWLDYTPPGSGYTAVLLLPLLAVMAELMPLEFPRRGLRVSFALPFLAATCVLVSPWVAVAVDVFGVGVSSIFTGAFSRNPGRSQFFIPNIVVAAVSGTVAALVAAGLQALSPCDADHSLALLGFVGTYMLANIAMLRPARGEMPRRGLYRDSLSEGSSLLLICVVFSLVALAAFVLAKNDNGHVLALMLVPIWALRTVLAERTEMHASYFRAIQTLVNMLQKSHPGTYGHVERIGPVAEAMALRMNLSPHHARRVREAAILHDLGKIGVDERILDKPGKLTPEELDLVRKHPEFGARILEPVSQFSPIVPWIRHHHERLDGKGYPDGLAGDNIPIESRIVAVVDAYDAMTGMGQLGMSRPYRAPMAHQEAMKELYRNVFTQFDPVAVRALEEVLEMPS